MTATTLGVVLAFVAVLLGLIVAAVGARFLDNRAEQRRIQSFVIESQGQLERRNLAELQGREFSQALIQRTLGAWLGAILTFLSRLTPPKTIEDTNRRLIIAGSPFNLRAGGYYGARVLLLILGTLLGLMFYRLRPSPNYLLVALLLVVAFLAVPELWLRTMMRRRQTLIRRSLPDALDMLSVITDAGLGFDQAMLRVGQGFKTPIGLEFARVVSEIDVGVSRRQALRHMQARVDIKELSSFVAVILQSEQLGMSIASVLHSQADQMRLYRQLRGKELAQRLPARMVIPLALFIFPALFAVIMGPFFPLLLKLLGG
jgi:tight adherence protein C